MTEMLANLGWHNFRAPVYAFMADREPLASIIIALYLVARMGSWDEAVEEVA